MIVYTLVKPEIREYMKEAAEKEDILAYDIIGPLMDQIQMLCGETPMYEPGLFINWMRIILKKLKRLNLLLNMMMGVIQEEF